MIRKKREKYEVLSKSFTALFFLSSTVHVTVYVHVCGCVYGWRNLNSGIRALFLRAVRFKHQIIERF